MNEDHVKRVKVVKVLIRAYAVISLFAFIYLLINLLVGDSGSIEDMDLKLPIIGIFIIALGGFYLSADRYYSDSMWWAIALIQVFLSYLLLLFYGTTQAIPYLSLTAIIYSSSIIYNWRFARTIALLFIFLVMVIMVMQNWGLNILEFDQIDSNPVNTIVLCLFLWVNVQIAKIGYEQIEHSYSQSLKYSKELEELNRDLDQKVVDRTEELERSWIERVRSLERVATIGSITSSLLHDLKTPLSTIGISMDILREQNVEDGKGDAIKKIEIAHEQIVKILDNSEDLMKDKKVQKWFYVEDEVDQTLELIENILSKNNIEVVKSFKHQTKLFGNSTMFLRVILNLIMNSIEELIILDDLEYRQIEVFGERKSNQTVVKVKDNGRGLTEQEIDLVFNKGYGKKHDSKHFGLGLGFVKETIENEFDGQILIRSQKGEFTEVIMKF